MHARFRLGTCVVTPGALEILNAAGIAVLDLLERHAQGDWGELEEDDRVANEQALDGGDRLLSHYRFDGGRCWVLTEADRSVTTVLLPEEY
jgi:hypothetical protein